MCSEQFLCSDRVGARTIAARIDSSPRQVLSSQGLSGDELITQFAVQRNNIKKAVGLLIDEADEIADGKRKGAATKDIFGEE